MSIVVVIDTDKKRYWSHHLFDLIGEAFVFQEGMEAAWKISHGESHCWHPFVLDCLSDLEEWKELGSPGKEIINNISSSEY